MDIPALKQHIDLHDLAERLGLERPGGAGNYKSPTHADKSPSLSIYGNGKKWKDWSDKGVGGDCVDLIMLVERITDPGQAIRRLHELYGLPMDRPEKPAERREKTRAEWIAEQCMAKPRACFDYLMGRGIPEKTLDAALAAHAIGFNDWTNPKVDPGVVGHGGPAAAFVVRDWNTSQVVGVDFRYLDPALNGGVKTKSAGEKQGVPWMISRRHIERAHRVYVVESAINALVVEGCGIKGAAALAMRGTGNASNLDWSILKGKQVILVMDADEPNERDNRRPGPEAAWEAYDQLVAQNIAALMVDQKSWYADGLNDLADIAKAHGIEEVRARLLQLEPWAVQGMPGQDVPAGRSRVFLPEHDFAIYWRFRVKPDFTSYVAKVEEDEDGGVSRMKFDDVAGFRVAAISRVTIQGYAATMSGEDDAQPNVVFVASVQTPAFGPELQRAVLTYEQLNNVERWKKLGKIFAPARFLRLLNILERTTDCGAREAANFVGLCWKHGALVVNEGPDCYFTEPEKQCPYHNLRFPTGTPADARRVLTAYQGTFHENAALLVLVWALGGHLKAITGFWPHMVMQADKGSGKSTLIKRLERTIGMTMFGGQSLGTEYRLLTSISHTSHPIGWEELSARGQKIIDQAMAILQEAYQYTPTRRGSEMTEYLISAPVLLAGEDVPAKTLTGKLVRTELTGRMGPELPAGLPRFPVREWLRYLATLDREQLATLQGKCEAWLWQGCRSSKADTGAGRMVRNYGALAATWRLLCDFAGMAVEQGDFLGCLRREMNAHISETSGDREPFVWILEHLAGEIESRQFQHPFKFDVIDGEDVLILRPQHVMDHLSTNPRLRDIWNGLPVKTGRVFKRQLDKAGLIVKDELDQHFQGRRFAHMTALSLKRMAGYAVHLGIPDESFSKPGYERAANE